jgi:hypothetical protein
MATSKTPLWPQTDWQAMVPEGTYGIYDYQFYTTRSGPQCLLKGKRIFVAVYIDGMLLFCKLISTIISFKDQLATIFPTTDLGEARWILNMEIIHN